MTVAEARSLLTPKVRQILQSAAERPDCITPDALIDAGVPSPLVGAMLADSRDPIHEIARKARVSLRGRGRRESRAYVWTPDIPNYLRGWA